jgi:hypothetical protein
MPYVLIEKECQMKKNARLISLLKNIFSFKKCVNVLMANTRLINL